MDTSDVYPRRARRRAQPLIQRLAQLGSLVTAEATVKARRRAQAHAARAARDERALSAMRDQERAAWQLARAGWATRVYRLPHDRIVREALGSTTCPGCRTGCGTSRHASPAGAVPATRNSPPMFSSIPGTQYGNGTWPRPGRRGSVETPVFRVGA